MIMPATLSIKLQLQWTRGNVHVCPERRYHLTPGIERATFLYSVNTLEEIGQCHSGVVVRRLVVAVVTKINK